MATTVAVLEAQLRADTRHFDRNIDQSGRKMSKFGSIAKAGALGAGAAIAYGLGKVAKIGWDEFNQGQKVAAQTNAVIQSTGGVANVTAKQVDKLGKALMLKSGVDDEVIKSGQNMLLTFTNIRNEVGDGNDIFEEATKLTLDMSVAMGKDMNSSAIMVGKALNNPIKGLTALTRVGVSFTAQQEKQIKALVKSGDTMEAQKIILGELTKEFGGSAMAAGETLGGQINILRERFNNWAGDMVAKAIPMIQRLAAWLQKEIIPAVKEFAQQVASNWPQIRETIGTIIRAMRPLVPLMRVVLKVAGILFTLWIRYVAGMVKAIATLVQAGARFVNWLRGDFMGTVRNVFNFVRDHVNARLERVRAVFALVRATAMFTWNFIRDRVQTVVDAVGRIIGKLRDMVAYIKSIPGKIKGALGSVGGFFGNIVGKIPGRGDFGSFGLGGTSLVALGRQLQSMGFQVGEHPAFGGVSPVHVPGSYHYSGRALDINWPGGGAAEMSRLDWLNARLRRMPGIKELLWRTAGHFDHLHVAMDKAGWHTLRPGLNIVGNYTGRPEPVYATGRGGTPGGVTIYLTNNGVLGSEREVLAWLRNAAANFKRTHGRAAF